MTRNWLAGVLLAVLILLPVVLFAETVHLKDGRKFSGTVYDRGEEVELDTGYGVLHIGKEDILRIEGKAAVEPEPREPEKSLPKPDAPGAPEKVKEAVFESITSDELSEHIHHLASEELEGRMTGTKGFELARDYIVKEFKSYGLKPCGDSQTYLQKFPTRSGDSWNVVGCIEGSDPVLKAEVVVIGAHYDHVGKSRDGEICPGADDNASGTSGVLEIAEAFAEKNLKPKRTILFICFGSEEIGLVGSRYYCENPIFPLDKTTVCLNLDMIARGEENKVTAFGAKLSTQLSEIIDRAAQPGLMVEKGGVMPASDHHSFHVKGVPAVLFCTGMHQDLHRPTDLPYKCDFRKAEIVAEVIALVAVGAAQYDGKIEMEKAPEGESPWGRGRRRGPRLGITPHPAELDKETREKFGLGEQDGALTIESVTPDSVAAKGGLKEGDILIELGGEKVPADELWRWLRGVIMDAGGKDIPYVVIRDGKKVKGTLKFPQSQDGPAGRGSS